MIKFAAIPIVYSALAGLALWSWLRLTGGPSAWAILVCLLPLAACAALAFTSQTDQEQYVMRLLACGMMTPILLGFWAFSQDAPAAPTPTWLYGGGAALLHAAAFVGAIGFLGTSMTRIPAPGGVPPVSLDVLQARLYSLNEAASPLDISPAAEEMVVAYRFRSAERGHRVLLTFNTAERSVRVRERLSANDAAPVTDAERSLRRPGDPLVDPARPDASSISFRVAQTSFIKPDELAATPVTFASRQVSIPAAYAARLDTDGMVTLLCKVVTQSGWTWQPAFFGAE